MIPDKILIVDDTQENIALLTELLQNRGYQISAARDGERAIKIARHIQPDLILMDIMMPGINGFEACQHLKRHAETKNIPVIFISAKTSTDDLVKGFSVGAADYINKPFNKDEVYARIKHQLKITQLNHELALSELNLREMLVEHQQQSAQLNQIVTLVADGIIELNGSGEIQKANPAIEKLFGYSTKALQSLCLYRLFAEPFAQQYDNFFSNKHVLSTNMTDELIAIREDGTEFPIQLSLKKIPSRENSFLAVIHDITTYKIKEKKLLHLSYIDSLTGLSNRRYFDEHYEKIWRQGMRNKIQIAFIMIDIDFFKQFNDNYGHQRGDICLKKIAQKLKENIKRPSDIIARVGGEEFAVVLPETSREGVIQIAKQLNKEVQALKIEHLSSNFKVVTISLGIAVTTIGEQCDSASMLYQMADEALYHAKQSGRNQYSVF